MSETSKSNPPTEKPIFNETVSAWSPFKISVFRYLWLATLASNIGTWMHDIGAGWLMTSLTDSPVMVALVQTATTLPVFLLALPAGTLSDIIDRRRHLLFFQVFLAVIAATLAIVAFSGLITPWLLIALTFGMGIGAAMMMPAWAAIVPDLVPRSHLQAAISLNSMGINVARAVGPAIAGVIISQVGTGAVFALNALSFGGVILVLATWKRKTVTSDLPAERVASGMRAGLRYAKHSPYLQAAILRGLSFFLFASASWALLPLIAKALPDSSAQTFGILVASVGAGAVFGALILPPIKEKLTRDQLVAVASLAYALCLVSLALIESSSLLYLTMAVSGVAWIAILSSLQVTAQLSLPNWVRSRGLSIYMSAFMGSMALGSLLWGKMTDLIGLTETLLIAAVGMALCLPISYRWKLSGGENIDFTPTMHWPVPPYSDEIAHNRGPVLVSVVYQVKADGVDDFLAAIQQLGKYRRRDGAFTWGIFQDTENEGRFIETFNDESWLEHLRRHERVSEDVRSVQERIRTCLEATQPPEVSHAVAPLPTAYNKTTPPSQGE